MITIPTKDVEEKQSDITVKVQGWGGGVGVSEVEGVVSVEKGGHLPQGHVT